VAPDAEGTGGGPLDAAAMEEQFRAAREAAERQFRAYQQGMAAELARNVSEAFVPPPLPVADAPALDDVPIADLHRLDQADSRVRHSVVEACFYNLRLYSDLLLDRRQKPTFREKLEANLAHLPTIQEELTRHFAAPVGEHTLAALFPRQEAAVSGELALLARCAADLLAHYDDRAVGRRFAASVPRSIDRIMAALGEVTAHLRAAKADLVGLLRQVVGLHQERLAAQGIALRFTNQDGETAPCFARPRDLLTAFGELVNNAARHGLADLPPDREKVISLVLRLVTVGQPTYQVDVADNGRGVPAAVQEHLGTRGVTTGGTGEGLALVRQIIERDHLGAVAVLSRPGAGTLIRLHLPRTLALPMTAGS
jgi:signal transduction histidine kinase